MNILSFVAVCVVSVALVAGGYVVGDGLRGFRGGDRYVSVKGLAEKEVKADLAIWQIRTTATGDDLATLQAKIDSDAAAITAFLIERGFAASDIQPQRVEVTDVLANQYRSNEAGKQNRYIIARTLLVRSANVDSVEKTSSATGDLVKKGIVLDYSNPSIIGPFYLFTKLNDIKPEMIAEATRNARASGEQFAKDSGSALGAIRQASQGYFTILPRNQIAGADESNQLFKTVRVVTTIDYQLAK